MYLPVAVIMRALALVPMVSAAEQLIVQFADWGKRSIPSDAIHPNVTRLSLQLNLITEIRETDLANFYFLQYIDMAHNPLTTIHERAFINNVHLTSIALKGCSLITLPVNYGGALQWTTEVGIKQQLSAISIPTDYFVGWPKLQKLKINTNPSINELLFDLPDLRELQIMVMEWKTFPNLCKIPRLELLKASRNLFLEIPEEAITCLHNLSEINLKFNLLTSLPDLLNLPLQSISLTDNPITCDNKLCWLRMWEYVKPNTIVRSGTCHNPSEISGLDMNVVRPSAFHCYEGK